MHRRLVEILLLLFLVLIGLNWPALPFNSSLADLIFIPLAISVVTLARTRWSWRWFDTAVAAYLLGALPSLANVEDASPGVLELIREGYLVALYVVMALAVREGFARTIGKGLALGGSLLAIAGLVVVVIGWWGTPPWPPMGEVMALPYVGEVLRLRAMTASEAMLACVLTAAAPFAITLCASGRARPWCAASIATIAAAGLTFSHAIAGFAVAALIAAWPSFATLPRLRRVAVAGVVLICLVLNFAATISIKSVSFGGSIYADASAFYHAVDQGETRVGGATVTYTVMSYARIKQVAWDAFTLSPISGIGLDNFHWATQRAYSEGRLPHLYSEIDPHSTLLGRLAETGLIGAVTLLLLWAAWTVMARDASRDTIGYAAAAALAGLAVSSLNADIMNFRFLWVIAGLMRGLQEPKVTSSGRGESDTAGAR